VVAKHRRSVIEPGAPMSTTESWPEVLAYGQTGLAAEPDWAALQDESWQGGQDWQDWGPPPELHHDHPSAPLPRFQFPSDHPSAPMPALRPGAPDLPRRRPAGPARPGSAPSRAPGGGYVNGNRRLHAVPNDAPADYGATASRGTENLAVQFPERPRAALADPYGREATGFHRQHEATGFYRQHGPARRDATGSQRQTGPGWQQTPNYRRETGPYETGPGPATGGFQNGPAPDSDTRWRFAQVLTLADGQAAQIAQDAQDYAAAVREAAEREAAAITDEAANRADAITQRAADHANAINQQAADRADAITQEATGQAAAIREAAEREAAEFRARLDSMSGELGRLAAYVTENLASPVMPAIAPVLPGTRPALPGAEPVLPDISPARPDTGPTRPDARPSRPDTRPGTRTATPDTRPGTRTATPDTRPGTRTARPGTAPRTRPGSPATQTAPPTKKGQALGRQRRAMRIATAGTAALLSIAAVGAVTYTGIHGFSFFVFREGGQGETPGSFLDTNFLARQAAGAQHHDSAPKGRHHKATAS
jgi:hypothetical protein